MSDNKTTPTDEAYQVQLNDVFKLRVLETKRDKTQKQDPTLIHTLELFDNPPIRVGDKDIDINGIKIQKWSVMTDKALKFFNIERKALGLPEVESYTSVSDLDYKGMSGFAVVSSELVEKKNEVTGQVMLNPYTRKPMTDMRRSVDQWIVPPEDN